MTDTGRRLTRMIALRLWVVAVALGAGGAALLWAGISASATGLAGLGASLTTIGGLTAPIALTVTAAALAGARAASLPRWLLAAGGAAAIAGLALILLLAAAPWAIVTFAVGIWVLVVGVIAGFVLALSPARF